ncbi:uncharacterized protein LOC117176493 [Belonocnema kinseyi]|uniref:uncharacterized protein LOC117176493 n=1 Tax=Belonocnema kinseyi TaxID=2817044 RepID=UPI00143D59C5|nr:uncharacterized protein LOC117176493 [Belonocnema kinseyi]
MAESSESNMDVSSIQVEVLAFKFAWRGRALKAYTEQILVSPGVSCTVDDVDELNENLISAISVVADKLDLVSKPFWRVPGKKPWFDRECDMIRRKLKDSLQKYKDIQIIDSILRNISDRFSYLVLNEWEAPWIGSQHKNLADEMILRFFGIYILGFIIKLRVFSMVNGEEINLSTNNLLLVENNYNADSFSNIDIKTNFKTSENSEKNKNLENSVWVLNIPLLPVVVATSNSIPEGPCRKQLKFYLNHLKNGTLWATEMFDSSAKYPYGIFDGHLRHLGNFDQCFRIETQIPNSEEDGKFEEIRSRYCLVDIKYQEKEEPKNFPGKLDIWFDSQGSAWESIREKGDFRRFQRYLLQMALCVPASCHLEDITTALKEPLEKFSKQYNVEVQASIQKDLCQAAHEATEISNYAIAYCIVLISIITLVIVSTIYDAESKALGKQSITKELLFCFSARRSLNNIFRVTYRHRGLDCLHMLRIIFTSVAIAGHRQIQTVHTSDVNSRFFEWTITEPLGIMFHNGSIIVDGFLGIGGLVLSYQLLEYLEKSKRLNVPFLIINRFVRGNWKIGSRCDQSLPGPIAISYFFQEGAGKGVQDVTNHSYVVGIIMGAFIYDYKFAAWRLPKMWSRILFILQVVVLSIYIQRLGFQFMDPNERPSLLVKAFYASFHRPIFAFSICSAALLITIGDGLDFQYNFLTPRWIQPISKLSYAVYLLHFAIQSYDLGTARKPSAYSFYNLHTFFVIDGIFVLTLSLFFAVMIEEPFKNIGNLVLKRKKQGNQKSNYLKKGTRNWTDSSISEYF